MIGFNSRGNKYQNISYYLPCNNFIVFNIITRKPEILGANKYYITTSNCRDHYCWAVSRIPVGIDIEPFNISSRITKKHIRKIKSRFNEIEQRELEKCNNTKLEETFLVMWTRKEAYAKAFGQSIFKHLDTNIHIEKKSIWVGELENKLTLFISFFLNNYILSIVLIGEGGLKMDSQQVEGKIIEIIKDYLDSTGQEYEDINSETRLIGSSSILSSVGLVSIVMDLEEWLSDQGYNVSLTSEKAMSMQNSPFKTVESLRDFIKDEAT